MLQWIQDEYQIVTNGKLAGAGAHSYSEGNATGGSEEATGTVKVQFVGKKFANDAVINSDVLIKMYMP